MKTIKSSSKKLFPVRLVFLIDVLLTGVSFIASYVICSLILPDLGKHQMLIQLPVIVALSSIIFLVIGMYKGYVKYDKVREVYSIFNAICIANILTIVLVVVNGTLFMEQDLMVPLSIIIVHSILSFSVLVASRIVYKYLSKTFGIIDIFFYNPKEISKEESKKKLSFIKEELKIKGVLNTVEFNQFTKIDKSIFDNFNYFVFNCSEKEVATIFPNFLTKLNAQNKTLYFLEVDNRSTSNKDKALINQDLSIYQKNSSKQEELIKESSVSYLSSSTG